MSRAVSIRDYLTEMYQKGITDYWMPPAVKYAKGRPLGRINDSDCVIFACRRGEREIQLTEALTQPDFSGFVRSRVPKTHFFPLIEYHEKFRNLIPLLPTERVRMPLGKVLEQAGIRQIRAAEAEKFAHVTFFFDGRNEEVADCEYVRFDISKENYHIDLADQLMRFVETVKENHQQKYEFMLINFAAGDILGHVPDFLRQVMCAEAVDLALGSLVRWAQESELTIIITADHGLLEQAFLPDGSFSIAHTAAKVPFILIPPTEPEGIYLRSGGSLADVAPTVLNLFGIAQSPEMTGESLLILNNNEKISTKGVVLVVLDGWGIGVNDPLINPIFAARIPNLEKYINSYPYTELFAAGEHVGLLPGSPGNSETGHLTLGAGRVVIQDEVRIPEAIKKGELLSHTNFHELLMRTAFRQNAVHVLMLLSEQSSHGSIGETLGILEAIKYHRIDQVFIHCILDGRSAPPRAAIDLIEKFGKDLKTLEIGEIVTIVGRGFALDRSGDYQNTTQIAYEAFIDGKGYPVCVL